MKFRSYLTKADGTPPIVENPDGLGIDIGCDADK